MTRDTYLDHASSTPPLAEAEAAAVAAFRSFADPLSAHASGREARSLLERSRSAIAGGLGAQPDEIVLTSGGTESVWLALLGVMASGGRKGGRILISAVEHPSVRGAASHLGVEGFSVVEIPVESSGRIDLDRFSEEVRRPGTVLASIQHSNHEVGTLQPVAEAARLSREAGVWLHTDACQSVGRLPIDVEALGVDLLTLSGHKLGGIPGSGALYVKRGVPLAGFPRGDDRERHRRSGRENIPGAAAMATALRITLEESADQAARQWAMTGLIRRTIDDMPGSTLHGHPTQRAPHLVCFSVEGVDPEVLLMALDDRGFRISGGSVASGLPHDPSSVLDAMGSPGVTPMRISVGRDTGEDDVEELLSVLPTLVSELQKMETASAEALTRLEHPTASQGSVDRPGVP